MRIKETCLSISYRHKFYHKTEIAFKATLMQMQKSADTPLYRRLRIIAPFVLRQVLFRYVQCLFTNIQRQQITLKSSLPF